MAAIWWGILKKAYQKCRLLMQNKGEISEIKWNFEQDSFGWMSSMVKEW